MAGKREGEDSPRRSAAGVGEVTDASSMAKGVGEGEAGKGPGDEPLDESLSVAGTRPNRRG